MSPTTLYVVQPGDWLAKIAEQYGTTWQAIWNHPANATLRTQRGSPDILYAGDRLHIPVPPAEPPAPPAPPADPAPPASPLPDDPPAPNNPAWPYEPPPDLRKHAPTWECPEGICECGAHREEEPRYEHVIVFHDSGARRMPLARCRVYEGGRLISEEPAKANPVGELTVELRASTTSLALEWAPPELPAWPTLPYRKRYHVVVDRDARRATDRRLANLGFGRSPRRRENVTDYQRAYHQPETGDVREVQDEVERRHDRGQLPPFPPGPSPHARPRREDSAQADAASGPSDEQAPVHARGTGRALQFDPEPAASPTGGASGSSQGAAVPDAAHLIVLVRHQDGRLLEPHRVTLTLQPRRVPSMTPEEHRTKLLAPLGPGLPIHQYLEFHFSDVPVGEYEAVAHAVTPADGHAHGSTLLEVVTGSLLTQWGPVVVVSRQAPRLRMSLFDYNSSFAAGFTYANRAPSGYVMDDRLLDEFMDARIDDYSLVRTVTFSSEDVGHNANPPRWDRLLLPLGHPDPIMKEKYLRELVAAMHARGAQVIVGYEVVERGTTVSPHGRAFREWLSAATPAQAAAHGRAIVEFFTSRDIPIDGVGFNLEVNLLGPSHHDNLVALFCAPADVLKRPGSLVYYDTAPFRPNDGQGAAPNMVALKYNLATERSGLIARPMCYNGTALPPSAISQTIDCALREEILGGGDLAPSHLQIVVDVSRTPDVGALCSDVCAPKEVGMTVFTMPLGGQSRFLERIKGWEAALNPGTPAPGTAGVPLQVPRL